VIAEQLVEFWDPLCMSGTAEARKFKFGMHVDKEDYYQNKCKIRSKGVVKG